MKDNIMKFINELEGYKTAIKNQHWSSDSMTEHKLFDDIASSVSDIQDMTAEISQGIYGKIKKNELNPIDYTIDTPTKFLEDLHKSTNDFYSTIKEGDEYIGLRSEIEGFIGEIEQFKYLMTLALDEATEHKMIIVTESAKNRLFNESIAMDKERGKNARAFRISLHNALKNGDYDYDIETNTIQADGYSYEIGKKYAEDENGEPIPLHYTYKTVMRDINSALGDAFAENPIQDEEYEDYENLPNIKDEQMQKDWNMNDMYHNISKNIDMKSDWDKYGDFTNDKYENDRKYFDGKNFQKVPYGNNNYDEMPSLYENKNKTMGKIKLTEKQLHDLIKKGIMESLKEIGDSATNPHDLWGAAEGMRKKGYTDNAAKLDAKAEDLYHKNKNNTLIGDTINNFHHYLGGNEWLGKFDHHPEPTMNENNVQEIKGQYALGSVAGRAAKRRNNAKTNDEWYKQHNTMRDAESRYKDLSSSGKIDMSFGAGRINQQTKK